MLVYRDITWEEKRERHKSWMLSAEDIWKMNI